MAQPVIYRTPPIAGRPPYATDEPDSVFRQQPASPTRVLRQQLPPDPNARTSAYNVYDQYLDSQNPFDDSKQVPQQPRIPLAAPRPGYAAPVAALNLSRPSPTATPEGRPPASPEMSQVSFPKPLTLVSQQTSPRHPPSPGPAMPNTPHPLQAPMTPIAPAFIRPSNSPSPRDVKFQASRPILRGNSEETLLPKRGQQGEEFWRRFSMVAKEDTRKPQSAWLSKTVTGTNRMSRWVFLIGIVILIVVVGAIGLGVYISHKDTSNTAPTAIGGSADETSQTSSSAAGGIAMQPSSTSLHVTPTLTLKDRAAAFPTGVPHDISFPRHADSFDHIHLPRVPARHRRSPVNRTPSNRTSH